MSVKTRCPNLPCSQINAVDPSQVRQRVRCPSCGTRYVPESTLVTDPPAAATRTRADAPPAPDADRIGRFVIRERLGAGAFGTVYRAYDPHLDREVALKVPHPSVLENAKQVERFLREAKAAANLTHPGIVPVFDAGTDGGRPYIATAFVPGRPLSELIEEGGMEYDRAARLARELADALAYAHSQGVVHRDVKPANVLVDEQDHAHLMDFGLAARQDVEARLTNDGAVLGTPAYMAPEQAAGQQGEAHPAVDQYAAGVVLYEMLTGRAPFRGVPAAVIFNVLHTEPPPITAVRPRISRDLDTVCRKAMAKRPDDRYPDCRAFADDLRRWLEREAIRARRPSAREQFGRLVRKNRAAAAAVGLVLVVLTGATCVASLFAIEADQNAARAWREQQRAEEASRESAEQRRAAEAAREQAQAALREGDGALGQARAAQAEADRQSRRADKEAKDAVAALTKATDAIAELERAQNQMKTETDIRKAVEEALRQYQRGRPQLYAHISRLIETERRGSYTDALAIVADKERGWEWRYLAGLRPGLLRWADRLPDGFGREYYRLTGDGLARVALSTAFNELAVMPVDHPSRARKAVLDIPGRGRREGADGGPPRNPFNAGPQIGLVANPPLAAPGEVDGRVVLFVRQNQVYACDVGSAATLCVTATPKLSGGGDDYAPPSGGFVSVGAADDRAAALSYAALVSTDGKLYVATVPPALGAKGRAEPSVFGPVGDKVSTAVAPAVRVTTKGAVRIAVGGRGYTGTIGERKLTPWEAFDRANANLEGVTAAAFSPSGKWIALGATGATDQFRTIRLLSADCSNSRDLLGHTGDITALAFAFEESRLVSAAKDGTVKVWDVETAECLLTLPGESLGAVQFGHDDRRLWALLPTGKVRVWTAYDRVR